MASGTYCITGSGSSAFSTSGGPLTLTGGDVVIVFTNASGGASIGGNTTTNFSSLQIYTQNGDWGNQGSTTLSVPGVFRFYATGSANYHVSGGSTETLPNGFFYLNGGVMDWQGSTNLNLQAPTTAPYANCSANVAIFSPVSDTNTMQIYGGSTIKVTGTILHPGGEIYLQGSGTVNALKSQLVGNTIVTNGGDVININYSPSQNIGATTAATVELIK